MSSRQVKGGKGRREFFSIDSSAMVHFLPKGQIALFISCFVDYSILESAVTLKSVTNTMRALLQVALYISNVDKCLSLVPFFYHTPSSALSSSFDCIDKLHLAGRRGSAR